MSRAGLAAGLPPVEVGPRVRRAATLIGEGGEPLDALLVTALPNVRWLTGFTGSAARAVLFASGDVVLVTDGRYRDQSVVDLQRAGSAARVEVGTSGAEQQAILTRLLSGTTRLGLEADHVTWDAQRQYEGWFEQARLVPTSGLLDGLRQVKDAAEVARIEAAADLADAALADILDLLSTGATEAEVALALDSAMRRRGADGPGFETIVAAGPNAALPHHAPDRTPLAGGHLVVLDFGAAVDGYRSDMTRTLALGEPADDVADLLAAATGAQAAGAALVAPGVPAREVDAACRDHLEGLGLAELFTHGTGHGVGLLIHEGPWLNRTSADVLAGGEVLTVEPGVYRLGSGGARVEDTLLVTATGARPLTKTPKDLPCLPSPRTN